MFHRQIVQQAGGAGVDDHHLLFHGDRPILRLLQNFHQPFAASQLLLRRLVQLGAEQRERRQFAILRQIQSQRSSHLPHRLDLRAAAHAAHRETDVDGGTNVGVEQIGQQEDLAVGDRNHVGRNVRRDIAGLRFNDGQSRQRSAAFFFVQLGRALQQPAVKVEHVARIRFAPRRTAQQQRNLAIRRRVFGKIVVDAKRMPLGIAEKLAHRAARVRRDVLHGRWIGRSSRYDDGVFHGAVIFQRLHHLRHRGALLADRDVNANYVAALLIDDGVERDGGLAGLAVANDQLALAAADRNHRIDRLDAGLQRLFHPTAVHNAGSDGFHRTRLAGRDGPLAVDRNAQRIHHPADQSFAHRHRHDLACAADFVAFPDLLIFAQQHRSHLVFFQIERDTGDAMRELHHLARHHVFQAENARDAVAHRNHRTGFGNVDRLFVILNLAAQQP